MAARAIADEPFDDRRVAARAVRRTRGARRGRWTMTPLDDDDETSRRRGRGDCRSTCSTEPPLDVLDEEPPVDELLVLETPPVDWSMTPPVRDVLDDDRRSRSRRSSEPLDVELVEPPLLLEVEEMMIPLLPPPELPPPKKPPAKNRRRRSRRRCHRRHAARCRRRRRRRRDRRRKPAGAAGSARPGWSR